MFYPEAPVLKAKGVTLEVSAPCALVLRETDTECYVSVTDARMDATLKEITLVWNGQKIVVPMPQGISCGKSVTVCVKNRETIFFKVYLFRSHRSKKYNRQRAQSVGR